MIKRWEIAGFRIKWSIRPRNSFPGRFGAGWNWKVGVQAGGGTVLFSLLIAELMIERR